VYNSGLFPDSIIEVKPTFTEGGTIVWEWHAWDHLIQDYDSTKANYGVVADHPELIDINFGTDDWQPEWLHINSIDYNEKLDQILLSSPTMNEIFVIDHSTTIQEAAGHTGGRYGKGGDLLYRWGNPQNYHAGDKSDQQLFFQHDARWIEPDCPGAGDITVFNSQANPSSVDEIVPPVDSNGNYYLEKGRSYGPEEPIWNITSEDPYIFESGSYSGVQRLPDGNILISSADRRSFFVVTPEKKLVWKAPIECSHSFNGPFRMEYYPSDYPGLSCLSLSLENGQSIIQNSQKQSIPQSTPQSQPSSTQQSVTSTTTHTGASTTTTSTTTSTATTSKSTSLQTSK